MGRALLAGYTQTTYDIKDNAVFAKLVIHVATVVAGPMGDGTDGPGGGLWGVAGLQIFRDLTAAETPDRNATLGPLHGKYTPSLTVEWLSIRAIRAVVNPTSKIGYERNKSHVNIAALKNNKSLWNG